MTPKNPTQDFTKEAIQNRYWNLMTTIELSNSGLQILIFLLLSRQTSFLVFFSLNPQRKKKKSKQPKQVTNTSHVPSPIQNT